MKILKVLSLLMVSVFVFSSCNREEDNGIWNDRKNEGLKGQVKKVTEINAYLSTVSRVMEFNSDGFFTYDKDGEFWTLDYKYDSQNRVTGFDAYNEDGYIGRMEVTYNGNNRERIMYSAQNNPVRLDREVLNDKGMVMSTSEIRYGVEASRINIKRNEKGQVIESENRAKDVNAYNFTSFDRLEEMCFTTKNTYNSEGSLESYVTSYCGGPAINSAKYTYKYDNKKNWIEMYNEDGELIRTRTIQYY